MGWIDNDYFKPEEFDSPDMPGSGLSNMQPTFITKLVIARKLAGTPFKVNSGYRSPAHNKKVGGVKDSSHIKGWAADIACTDSTRFQIVSALIDAGFSRIGIGRTYIHMDMDPAKPKDQMWHYYPSVKSSSFKNSSKDI